MRLFSKCLIVLGILMMMSCTQTSDKTYIPSIAALKPNETLVMKFEACHWGCTKGTVKFKNRKAQLRFRQFDLTSKEIEELDKYFLNGPDVAFQERCSLPIKISFKLKKGLVMRGTKDTQIYSCSLFEDDKISPFALVNHLKETSNEKPIWRLSQEERDNISIFD